MALMENEHGELYRSDDFEEPRRLKLKPCGNVRIGEGPKRREPRYSRTARCDECGAEFAKKTWRHRFCSKRCAERNRRRRKDG